MHCTSVFVVVVVVVVVVVLFFFLLFSFLSLLHCPSWVIRVALPG